MNASLQTSVDAHGNKTQTFSAEVNGYDIAGAAGLTLASELYSLGGGKSAEVGVVAQAGSMALTAMAQDPKLDFSTAFENALPAALAAYAVSAALQQAGLSGPGGQIVTEFASSLVSQVIGAATQANNSQDAIDAVDKLLSNPDTWTSTADYTLFSVAEQAAISAWARNSPNSADIDIGADIGAAVGTVIGWIEGEDAQSGAIGGIIGRAVGSLIGSIFGPSNFSVGPDADAWIEWNGGTSVSLGAVNTDNNADATQS
jgi:hypothetical protein